MKILPIVPSLLQGSVKMWCRVWQKPRGDAGLDVFTNNIIGS